MAKEFKTLSEKTASHTALVEKSLMQLALNVTNLISISGDNIKLAQEVKACNSSIDHIVKNANNSLLNITSELSTIAEQTHSIDNKCNNLGSHVDKISKGTVLSTDNFEKAHHRINNLLSASETLIQLTAHMGAQTEDSKFIELAKETAKIIGKRFEQAINNNEISLEDLFDHNYQLIANTNPQQMMAKFTRFTDKTLPDFQEPLLDFDSRIVFTAAVDINDYLPTHNNKFSHPQTNDYVWNAANCRNRRLFNDRAGLAAGKNTNDFLLQTYRRDMGGGNFALMKDVSAPIMVKGRHWGGFRIGYKV